MTRLSNDEFSLTTFPNRFSPAHMWQNRMDTVVIYNGKWKYVVGMALLFFVDSGVSFAD